MLLGAVMSKPYKYRGKDINGLRVAREIAEHYQAPDELEACRRAREAIEALYRMAHNLNDDEPLSSEDEKAIHSAVARSMKIWDAM